MSISHSNDNATRRKGNEKKANGLFVICCCFFVETPQCEVCTEFVGAVVETRFIASVAESTQRMLVKNIGNY